MTGPLTIKDLNCTTCPKDNTQECPARPYNKFLVQFIGCASHPLALQVLAAPVITELEKRNEIEDARSTIHMPGGGRYEPTIFMNASGAQRGYSDAIKLLKGAP